jgi:sugar phosphate isomerase/epimerase
MYFGSTVWPFSWQPPYEDALRRIAALGFTGVELIAWSPEALEEYYTPARIADLRTILDGEGLILSEFVATPRGHGSLDPARRQEAVEYTRRVIEVAASLGTKTINHVPPPPCELPVPYMMHRQTSQLWTVDVPSGLDWQASWDAYVDTVARIAEMLEPADMRLAIEPIAYRWVTGAASLLRLAEAVGSPAVGLNLDLSQMFPAGEMPHITAYLVAERVFNTHFSDNDGLNNAHWRPGRGKIDWRALLKALHEIGYDGAISFELEQVPGVRSADERAMELVEQEHRLARDHILRVSEGLGINWRERA